MLPSHTLKGMLKIYNYTIDKHFEQLYIMKKKHDGTSNSPFANVGLEMWECLLEFLQTWIYIQ
jgi:hypothetical protein